MLCLARCSILVWQRHDVPSAIIMVSGEASKFAEEDLRLPFSLKCQNCRRIQTLQPCHSNLSQFFRLLVRQSMIKLPQWASPHQRLSGGNDGENKALDLFGSQ